MNAAAATGASRLGLRGVWHRFRRKGWSVLGLWFLTFFVIVAVLAPLLAPYTTMELADSFLPPDAAHPFGTDSLGSDVFSNVILGTRTSLMVGLLAVVTSTVIGITVGATAGYFGGALDTVLMRVTELFQVLPRFFLAIVIVAVFGSSIWIIIFVIGVLGWPATARLLRAEFLSLKHREFVDAARALGMTDLDLIVREILPNAMPPIIVAASLQVSGAILLEASLSFLGLGDPNVMSWGVMLFYAQEFFSRGVWMAIFPGLALFLTTLSLNLVGDGLNDALNPRLRGRD